MTQAVQAPLPRGDVRRRGQLGHGALAFLALTFAWSWAFFALAIALGGEWPQPRVLMPWAIGALGPVLMAFALTRRRTGRPGVRALRRATLAFRRIRLRWWVAMLVVAAFPNAAAIAVLTVRAGGLPSSVTGAELTLLSPIAILVFAFLAGLAEEPGWRGYALERLGRHRLLKASLLVGFGWALWHLPLFLIDGTFQNELGFGSQFWWFMLQILPTAVLLAWVYVRTGYLVAAAVALHALGNAAGELLPVEGGGRWIALAFLTAVAGGVVARDRALFMTVMGSVRAAEARPPADVPRMVGLPGADSR